MNGPIVRPAVRDLGFYLFGRPLHPELFDIVAMRKVKFTDFEVTVRITRTGHVITFENPDVLLTEVTADADTPLPEKRRLLRYHLEGEHFGKFQCAHGIHYEMSFQVEAMTPEVFLNCHEEILRDGSKRGMLHNFEADTQLSLAPLGYVTADARPGCLILTSFHTFPSEDTVVKTQSLIERR